MKTTFLCLILIFSFKVMSQNDSELLKKHYEKQISELIQAGDLKKAKEEFDNAKNIAPEIIPQLKYLETKIQVAQKQLNESKLAKAKSIAAKETQAKEKALVLKREEAERQVKNESEKQKAWQNSIPERRCACIDLAKYFRFLQREELSKPVYDKAKVYEHQGVAKTLEDAIKVLDGQVESKACSQPLDLTETMNYSKKFDLIQKHLQKCDLNEILH